MASLALGIPTLVLQTRSGVSADARLVEEWVGRRPRVSGAVGAAGSLLRAPGTDVVMAGAGSVGSLAGRPR